MKGSRVERSSFLSNRQYVLGRKEKTSEGVLTIGRYYALDGSLGAPVYLDILRPHIVFICGKRGYGKSYSIGVFLEEISALNVSIKQHLAVIVLDTLGIFWSTQFPSKDGKDNLQRWGCKPTGCPIRLFVPRQATENYSKKDIEVKTFSIRISDLSPYHWCQLFNLTITDPVGVALTQVILTLKSNANRFSIHDIVSLIQQDGRIDPVVKCAVQNFFLMADAWGVFAEDGISITDFVQPGTVTILDLSVLPSMHLKDVIVALLSEQIFEERVKSRKIFEQRKMGFDVQQKGIPLVWLVVDEAQVFLPSGRETLTKQILIEEWMRQGRQPGLSLLLATQRPSAIESEVLSHCDMFLCHRLTAQEDIDALRQIRPIYLQGDILESLRKIGSEKGVALLVDDTSESVHVIQLRPRVSWHGGAEPVIHEQRSS